MLSILPSSPSCGLHHIILAYCDAVRGEDGNHPILFWPLFGISVGGIGLLLYLIRRGQVSKAASLIYLCPPTVAIQALVAFGEPLTLPLIVGTVIVGTGVYLTNRKIIRTSAA